MNKRLISLFVAAAMLISAVPSVSAVSSTDITSDSEYAGIITTPEMASTFATDDSEEGVIELFATGTGTGTAGEFGVSYDQNTKTAEVTSYKGTATELVIDETLTIKDVEYTVTAVSLKNNETITSVTIPATVTAINAKAFTGCTALEYVYFKGDLPSSIVTTAFSDVSENFTVYYDLRNSESFENAIFQDETLKSAFARRKAIDSYFIIEDGVLTGVNPTVDGSSPRTVVTIPGDYFGESVTSIGENAFANMSGVTKIVIPESVKTISAAAFPESVAEVYFRCSVPTDEISLNSSAKLYVQPAYEQLFAESAYWSQFARETYTYGMFDFNTETGTVMGCSLDKNTYEEIAIPAQMYGVDVVSIGSSAFEDYKFISAVTIPDSVKTIGAYAFAGCDNLASINNETNAISAEYIDYKAFYNCVRLPSITLNGVQLVQSLAFFNCRLLDKIVVVGDPDVEWIEILTGDEYKGAIISRLAFSGNYVYNDTINISDGLAPVLSQGVTLSGISLIDDYAFNGTGMKNLTVPEGVTKIDKGAFAFCEALVEVALPSTLKTMAAGTSYKPGDSDREVAGNGVFSFCISLEKIVIPASVEQLGALAFSGCTKLAEVDLSANNTITAIELGTFCGCSSLAQITLPDSVTAIESGKKASGGKSTGAFSDCVSLKTVKAGAGLETIGEVAFYTCSTLENVILPGGVVSIGEYAFAECEALKSVACESGDISDALTSIGAYAFDGCIVLASEKEIGLPDCVTTIGKYAFRDCEALRIKDAELPAELTDVGDYAFSGCKAITEIKLPAKLTTLSSNMFEKSGLVTVTIPNTVTTIGKKAFLSCVSLKDVTAEDGETALSILESAFSTCTALENVTLERDSVSVGKTAFTKSTALNNFVTEGVNDISIGEKAFLGCSSLKNSGLRADITATFSDYAYNESGLEEFVVPDNVTIIPLAMFMDCTALADVTLHDGITDILSGETKNGAFEGCTSLKTIQIPESVTNIAERTFAESGLEEITLPDSVTVVKYDVFLDCTSLAKVNLGKNTTTIAGSYDKTKEESIFNVSKNKVTDNSLHGAFEGCIALKSIVFPDTVTTIGSGAFAESGLESFILPPNVTYIEPGSFYSCKNLSNVVFHDYLLSINLFAFAGCDKIAELEIPGSVTAIGPRAFSDNTSLETVRLGDVEAKTPTYLGNAAFYGCGTLSYIVFSGIIPTYNEDLFGADATKPTILYFTRFFDETNENDINWKENFTMVAIDEQFTYAETAEGGCNIEKYKGDLPIAIIPAVVIDNDGNSVDVTGISAGAFDSSPVKTISIPKSVTTIDNEIFFGADNLEKINVSSLNQNYKAVGGILYNKDGTTLVYCPSAKTGTLELAETVTKVEEGALYENSLTAIAVNENNNYYIAVDGVLFTKSGDTIVAYPNEKGLVYTISSDVTAIADYAFTGENMVLTFDTTNAPALSENSIADSSTIKIYSDASGFDADGYKELTVVVIIKPIIANIEKIGDSSVDVTYHNYGTEEISAKTFAALYKGGALVDVTAESELALAASAETNMIFEFDGTGDAVKIFIWDSFEGMVPIEEAKVQNMN